MEEFTHPKPSKRWWENIDWMPKA